MKQLTYQEEQEKNVKAIEYKLGEIRHYLFSLAETNSKCVILNPITIAAVDQLLDVLENQLQLEKDLLKK